MFQKRIVSFLQGSVAVEQGSGHFLVSVDNTRAGVHFDSKTRDVSFHAQAEGTFTISAHDLCLTQPMVAQGRVVVSDVHTIEAHVHDKVQIGHSIVARVQVLDADDKPLPVSYFAKMSLKAKTAHRYATITYTSSTCVCHLTSSPSFNNILCFGFRPDENIDMSGTVAKFVVKGVELGRTTLEFVATRRSGAKVRSAAHELQVFPPLRLEPRNVTLVVGTALQVRSPFPFPPPLYYSSLHCVPLCVGVSIRWTSAAVDDRV